MSGWSSPARLAATVVAIYAASSCPATAQTSPAPRQAEPAATRPAAPEAASDASDDPWEERKLRAREDVQFLEAFSRAKLAECREAELRYTYESSRKAESDRQHQKGYTSTLYKAMGELFLAEAQTQLELRRAEMKDAEIRLARARRRLKAVERSGAAGDEGGTQTEDRLHELELKFERLRDQMDRAKRVDDEIKLERLRTGN